MFTSNPASVHTGNRSPATCEWLSGDAALRKIQAQARYFFEPAEFARLTGRDPGSVACKRALDRLSKLGHIALASKQPAGWVIVPPEYEHYGAPPVSWWLGDCLTKIEPNYYVALLSAARHWGSAHYALQDTQVMMSKPRRELLVGRQRIVFFSKQALASTPTVTIRNGVAPWRVSTREATLLDLIRYQTAIGGLETVARIAKDFSTYLDRGQMLVALDALNQTAAAQRLGFLLEALNLPTPALAVETWLSKKHKALQILDRSSIPVQDISVSLLSTRWGIRYRLEDHRSLESLK
ncbi:hypothetical protein HAP94_20055 [Acidithiobacillus ferrivorans]|nr:hypothetical protein [Acidithiobacillus ferrivorans]